MPDQRRFRRLEVTSAAISVGTFALVIAGAGPADAATCPPGHDPAAALKNIQCQVQQAGQGLRNKVPTGKAPTPSTTPSSSSPKTGKTVNPATGMTSTAPGSGSAGTGLAAPTTQPYGSMRQLAPGGARQDVLLPGLAADQTPQVAWEQQQPLAPETHLVAPAATAWFPRSQVFALVVVGAAGIAGTAGALNVSVANRGRLRRATGRLLTR